MEENPIRHRKKNFAIRDFMSEKNLFSSFSPAFSVSLLVLFSRIASITYLKQLAPPGV